MVGPGEARQLQAGAAVRWSQHDDLAVGVGDADDGVHELALHEHPALDLQPQPDEERRGLVEVGDGDADVVEASYVCHEWLLQSVVPAGPGALWQVTPRCPPPVERSRPGLLDTALAGVLGTAGGTTSLVS